MRHGVIIPIYGYYGYAPILSELQFAFLTLSFVFITAAGYIINDYFDRKTDLINHPKTVLIAIKVRRRSAILLHTFFNLIALFCGFAISYSVGVWWLGFVFIAISLILWYYSVSYKKKPLIGNIIVSLLTAIVPLFVIGFEYLGVHHTGIKITNELILSVKYSGIIIIGFSCFAFIFNLIREIVKDVEDIEGDKATKCKTLPILIGEKRTNFIISALSIIGATSVVLVYLLYLRHLVFLQNDVMSIWYISTLIVAPVLYVAFRIHWAPNKKTYHQMSQLLKFVMLTGILYSLILNITITGNII
jgi:4-hydroxybenzoate polyprenyltransferase